jgi:hypothetical protein
MNRHNISNKSEDTDYSKILSITATLLLCAGIVSQTVYYFFFNIPITEFLNLSEVLLLFTQDVIRYIIIFLILLFISIIINFNKPSSRHKRFFIDYVQTDSFGQRVFMYLEKRFVSIIYYILGSIVFYVLLKEGAKIIYLFGLYFSIEVLYFFIRFYIFENRRKLRLQKKLISKDKGFDIFFSFGLHFIFFVVGWSLVDVQKVKYEQKYINVSFKLNNDSIVSSDSLSYYIGQTEKYLFHYNSKSNTTTTYKKENIQEIYYGKINYMQFKTTNNK